MKLWPSNGFIIMALCGHPFQTEQMRETHSKGRIRHANQTADECWAIKHVQRRPPTDWMDLNIIITQTHSKTSTWKRKSLIMYESSGKEKVRLITSSLLKWSTAAPEDGVHSLEPSSLCKDAPLNKTESYKHTIHVFHI